MCSNTHSKQKTTVTDSDKNTEPMLLKLLHNVSVRNQDTLYKA